MGAEFLYKKAFFDIIINFAPEPSSSMCVLARVDPCHSTYSLFFLRTLQIPNDSMLEIIKYSVHEKHKIDPFQNKFFKDVLGLSSYS